MDAFHSIKGRNMYQRLPKSKPESVAVLEKTVPEDTPTMLAFRKLRQQLEDDGWFERDLKREFVLLGIWGALFGGAIAAAHSVPFLSIFLLGLTMTQAGWLGHDYVHGVDKWCDTMRQFTTIAGGLGCTWWSDKHNKHHALSKYYITEKCVVSTLLRNLTFIHFFHKLELLSVLAITCSC